MERRAMLKGIGLGAMVHPLGGFAAAEPDGGVFELRIYHCADGRLPALLKRFREHTVGLFAKHGIRSVAYWVPVSGALDEPQDRTLVYVLKYPSRDEAVKMWKAFQDDPEWVRVKAESEKDGPIVEKVDSTFLELTDFSPKV
jgi:hypothetical protein